MEKVNHRQLVANVMANLFRLDIVGGPYERSNLSMVMEVFRVGSTRAHDLCKIHDLDPDEKLPIERHNEFWCDDCREVVESDLEACHGCERRICVDNCIAVTNEEHGLYFCRACYEKNPADPGIDAEDD